MIKNKEYKMRTLTSKEIIATFGSFLPALVALITVFTLPKIIADHTKVYNEWGHVVGETIWEHNHPYDPNQ